MTGLPKFPIKERIRQKGDTVEIAWADRICAQIPTYGIIWETYIGNDEASDFLVMPGVNAAVLRLRQRFWERLYSLFESLAFSWELERQFTLDFEVTDFESYAANLNRWIAFYAHLGRIHDMADDIRDLIRLPKRVVVPIHKFYTQRNIVVHGQKVPMKWVNSVLLAPAVGEDPTKWDDKRMLWPDASGQDFKAFADRVAEALAELEPLIDAFLREVLPQLGPRLGFLPVEWPEENKWAPSSRSDPTLLAGGSDSTSPGSYSGIERLPPRFPPSSLD